MCVLASNIRYQGVCFEIFGFEIFKTKISYFCFENFGPPSVYGCKIIHIHSLAKDRDLNIVDTWRNPILGIRGVFLHWKSLLISLKRQVRAGSHKMNEIILMYHWAIYKHRLIIINAIVHIIWWPDIMCSSLIYKWCT